MKIRTAAVSFKISNAMIEGSEGTHYIGGTVVPTDKMIAKQNELLFFNHIILFMLQGQTVGKVFVGGTEPNLDGTGTTVAFSGCIEVRV
jgi:hypothetical protein